jgi:uncharacterized protein YyaL (SSP411 family)
MANRLAGESSPYLRQHSQNPVDWYPWGEEAFQAARELDRPILLSVGYSACHWCHVMAHESFENPAVAEIMNRLFVNIKVDREERPDVDQIYMEAVQAITGSGGWPLTVFLTPQLKPFFGGTYFPPEENRALPAFPRVLLAAADAYKNRRAMVEGTIQDIARALEARSSTSTQRGGLDDGVLRGAADRLQASWDASNGGFGGAPKFPHSMALEFLLRTHLRTGDPRALEITRQTLDRMAMGGVYDQIGGGFHRYATDAAWQVPHFEKMLYDNALLSHLYLQAFSVSGYAPYARIAGETLDYLLREMRDENGGFYSTLDADSEGEEGRYYLWSRHEVQSVFQGNELERAEEYFGISQNGNFEGRNILHINDLEIDDGLLAIRGRLFEEREKRIRPGRDEKMLAAWNALTLLSLCAGAGILKRKDLLQAAENNASFFERFLFQNGKLMHSSKDGQTKIRGFLDDYALAGLGFLSLHRLTGDAHWLDTAFELTNQMLEIFEDQQSQLLFDTTAGQSDLILRPRNEFDGATPSGNSAATLLLLNIADLTGDARYRGPAEKALTGMREAMLNSPLGCGFWLCALDRDLAPPLEVVIAGDRSGPETKSLLETVNSFWLPEALVVAFDPSNPGAWGGQPLFKGRGTPDGRSAAYLCENQTCRAPIVNAEKLKEELAALASKRRA